MTSRPTQLRTRLAAVAVVGVTALVTVPTGVAPAWGSGSHRHASSHHGVAHSRAAVAIKSYDLSLFADVNTARTNNARHSYNHSRRVHRIARGWANHLASTGYLAHNPNLVAQITRACPHWTSLGENVGVEGGTSPAQMFSAYMNSPPHRANILDAHYTILGIATVSVTQDGATTQWNVMDFANHCG